MSAEEGPSGARSTVVLPVPRYPQLLDRLRWSEHGFESPEDSDVWSDRACGVACVAMILEFATGEPVSVVDLLHEGRDRGAYCERGWLHAGLAELLVSRGISASAEQVESVDDLAPVVRAGSPVIASVTLQFPLDGSKGGHLVLVKGVTCEADRVTGVHFNDPGRWGAENNVVSAERFAASFTGRIVRTMADVAVPGRVDG